MRFQVFSLFALLVVSTVLAQNYQQNTGSNNGYQTNNGNNNRGTFQQGRGTNGFQPPPPPSSIDDCITNYEQMKTRMQSRMQQMQSRFQQATGQENDGPTDEIDTCAQYSSARDCVSNVRNEMKTLHTNAMDGFMNCIKNSKFRCTLSGNPRQQLQDAITDQNLKSCLRQQRPGPPMPGRRKRQNYGTTTTTGQNTNRGNGRFGGGPPQRGPPGGGPGPHRCVKDFCPSDVITSCKNQMAGTMQQIKQKWIEKCNCLPGTSMKQGACEAMAADMMEHMDQD